MKDLTELKGFMEERGELRNKFVVGLRKLFDTEKYEGVDCASDEELELLASVGLENESNFEDCSLGGLIEATEQLIKWEEILD